MKKSTAQFLRENREDILRRWQERAYREVSATQGHSSLILRNSLSLFLSQIENALSFTDQRKSGAADDYGISHGIDRAATANYSIDQVIYEYHILREVLFEVLEANARLDQRERDLIIGMIEKAVNYSATNFSNTLRAIRAWRPNFSQKY